jgi:hypothetical protein
MTDEGEEWMTGGDWVERMKALQAAVVQPSGSTAASLRLAIVEYASRRARGLSPSALDAKIRPFVDDVVSRPTAADIEGLLESMSEDEIFEIVCAAAVGTGAARSSHALALLEEIPT